MFRFEFICSKCGNVLNTTEDITVSEFTHDYLGDYFKRTNEGQVIGIEPCPCQEILINQAIRLKDDLNKLFPDES